MEEHHARPLRQRVDAKREIAADVEVVAGPRLPAITPLRTCARPAVTMPTSSPSLALARERRSGVDVHGLGAERVVARAGVTVQRPRHRHPQLLASRQEVREPPLVVREVGRNEDERPDVVPADLAEKVVRRVRRDVHEVAGPDDSLLPADLDEAAPAEEEVVLLRVVVRVSDRPERVAEEVCGADRPHQRPSAHGLREEQPLPHPLLPGAELLARGERHRDLGRAFDCQPSVLRLVVPPRSKNACACSTSQSLAVRFSSLARTLDPEVAGRIPPGPSNRYAHLQGFPAPDCEARSGR